MTANELRTMYVNFFKERGHKEIASVSLLPENDPTVLFTTAGMHPLVPYLLGEKHPSGKRLTDVQKCVRTEDIDEVGDDTHCTFFEMLGNWSLGDYFKHESISMSFEFLTKHLNIPIERLAVTVFEGDEVVPADEEAVEIWKSHGLKDEQIFRYAREDNWWGPEDRQVLVDRTQKSSMIWVSRNVVQIVDHPAIAANMLRYGIMFSCSLTKRLMVALQSLRRKMWIQEWAWSVY